MKAELAKRLIQDTCIKQAIGRQQLVIHADLGSSMTSKAVAHLLADLGVTKTHSRPRVSLLSILYLRPWLLQFRERDNMSILRYRRGQGGGRS